MVKPDPKDKTKLLVGGILQPGEEIGIILPSESSGFELVEYRFV